MLNCDCSFQTKSKKGKGWTILEEIKEREREGGKKVQQTEKKIINTSGGKLK